jgi:acid stress-induced BolA-like protein IbaG/YrbA
MPIRVDPNFFRGGREPKNRLQARPGTATKGAMLDPKDIERRIAAALPGAEVEVVDYTGTGDHFQARVVSEAFAGKTMVEQHQMVYAPLQAEISSGVLHALALKTYTPEQWARMGGSK